MAAEHQQMCKAIQAEQAHSRTATCGICLENIMDTKSQFGLLSTFCVAAFPCFVIVYQRVCVYQRSTDMPLQ